MEAGGYRALHELAKEINSSLHLPRVLELVAEGAAQHLDALGCSICLLNPSGTGWEASASYGIGAERWLPCCSGWLETLAGASALSLPADDPQFGPAASELAAAGVGGVVVVPLRVHGLPIGLLHLYTAAARALDPLEQEHLGALAEIGAIAIENARLYQALEQQFEVIRGELATDSP